MEYHDSGGNERSLYQMIKREPEWAANRIRCAEAAEDKLRRIKTWCEAYPLDVFPEPDMNEARLALTFSGISLDAVSASNMRHVLKGIREIID